MEEARSWHIVLFLLCLSFYSGLCRNSIILKEDSSYEFSTTQLDSIPIVNPTTPGSGNPYPTVNPTSPQPPDTSTGGQSPTTPDTSPTNPYSNPPASTTPYSNPPASTNPYSNPTSPAVTPTTPTTTPTGPSGSSGGSSGGQWCVASPSAAETTLKVALDYACGYGADCSQIQQGGTCFDPNTLVDHASYAFNDYFQKNPAPTSCVFGGVASLTTKDPSHGNCHYSSSKTTSMSPPNPPTPPTTMTPPSPTTMTPPTPTLMTPSSPGMTMPDPDGGSSSVYGSPPGGSPNIATSTSFSILLLLTTSLSATLHLQNYI
ncbi:PLASMODESMATA CALLOSE-BINDING PROTEIN 1 [Lathyrus oleraceus]|uniref:X8 domain-containing protein n=1 Tax=Pisum sativum TaxID=3888 RepID=A0A9D5BE31_PEA|nr:PLASMODESMATA CALLOSE-BINDING PROTEIN 1-like [Pisum sativum]KAI5441039.1 hypothetical protein KIW84_010484 [Pisum sativum]